MVYSKLELFDKDLQLQARLFKALAHPARLAILIYLADIKTCITGDITQSLPLGRTTVNQHLKELKDAGLIMGITSGVKTRYCINPEKVKLLKELADEYFARIDIEEINC